ncbi:hypothetical protein AAW14_27505 [Streptomyces hygroscopicus]|uniref:hypothetical protein n=1 Tax=Streptomyces hygroscopicus TaxID=1912 RepID=UPI00223FEC7E|nr:hypothetical protein [Streptomyces hygroscopicus]MCW7945653.1 hypothetical protein [Streptomyces hygroscopicus]
MSDLVKGTTARLVFPRGIQYLTLDVAPSSAGGLYTARFQGPEPRVATDDTTVSVVPRGARHPFDLVARRAHFTLSPDVEWHIVFQGPAVHVEADLTGLRLRSLQTAAGMADAHFLLPETDRTVPIRLGDGARKITFRRPPGVGVSLLGAHGVTGLSLDGRWMGSQPAIDWRSIEETARGRYEITLDSGANRLTIA